MTPNQYPITPVVTNQRCLSRSCDLEPPLPSLLQLSLSSSDQDEELTAGEETWSEGRLLRADLSEPDDDKSAEGGSAPGSPSPMRQECEGVLVHWAPGSVWDTYPFHRHEAHTLGWELVGIRNDSWLQFRAVNCPRYILRRGDVRCSACDAIPRSKDYLKFVNRANGEAPETTPYSYLTYKQLRAVTVKLSTRVRRLELKVGLFPCCAKE